MKYYVYIYLDTSKPGNFEYDDLIFDYEPFYVGKGFGSRYLYHINKVRNKNKYKNSDKFEKIKKIIESGLCPKIIKLKEGLTENDSLILENETIKKIGRNNLNKGPLTNLNDGGLKPQDNYKHTEETKLKISKSLEKRVSKNFKLISPKGEVFENIRLDKFCRENELDYRKMRKFANRGKMKVRMSKDVKPETINCLGWEVINDRPNKKKPPQKIKYILLSPKNEKIEIYTHDSAKEIFKNLQLNFRLLKLYRNKGKIIIRDKKRCKNKTSMNCEGWEFIDVVNQEHDFTSKRKISWKIISPNKEIFYESNLLKFCEKMELSYRTFNTFKNRGTITMPLRKNYKQEIINSIGWQCQELN